MAQRELTQPFQLGDVRVHPMTLRLMVGERVETVEPKAMAVLLCLAQAAPQVVTREALLQQVWPDVAVGEDALNNAVAKLRRLLEDSARNPTYIETVPKHGYRLLVTPEFSVVMQPEAVETSAGVHFWPLLAIAIVAAVCLFWWFGRQEASQAAEVVASPRVNLAQPRFLTTIPGIEKNVALNHDGSLAAFAMKPRSSDNWDIYVQEPGGGDARRLTSDAAFEDSPSFSPDGSTLAFQRFDADGCAIYTVPVSGGKARRLADCKLSIYPDLTWSPSGHELAFSGRLDEQDRFGIVLLRVDSLIQKRVTKPAATYWGDHDPAFSADGSKLAFVRSASEAVQDLYLLDLASEVEQRLTFDGRNIVGVTWLDQATLLYATDLNGVVSLWRFGIADGKRELLSDQAWFVSKPAVSGDGSLLAFQQVRNEVNIWRANADGSQRQALLESTRWDLHPQVAPDGSEIAFSSNRGGSYEVWIAGREGSDARPLTQFAGPFTGTPRFSPDGARLAFDARPKGHADIFVIPRTGGEPRQLTDRDGDDLAPSWSQDGRFLYFGSARSGDWQVWRVAVDGQSEPEQVTKDGGFAAFESHDGAALYFTRFHHPGIWRLDWASGEVQQVVDDLAVGDWGNWGLSETALIYVVRQGDGSVSVRERSFDDVESVERFVLQALPQRDPALAVARDGAQVLYGKTEQSESDLLTIRLK